MPAMAKAAAMDRKEILFIRTSSVEQPPYTTSRTPRKRLNYSTDAKAKSTPCMNGHSGIRNMIHAELRKWPNDKARSMEISRDLADASFFVRASVSA